MRVVQAPEVYEKKSIEIACFLAGGCGDIEWQERVISELNKYILNSLVIYNPYNPNIESTFKQIEWEFNYLNKYINDHFIFSCYFDKYTDQPMTMYELGRASVLSKEQCLHIGPWHDSSFNDKRTMCYYWNYGFPMVVTIHPEAPKKQDIIAQCGLAHVTCEVGTPEEHALRVLRQYKDIRHQMGV